MKIAISGASGLIGTALARSLRLDGHDVLPLVRRPVAPGSRPCSGTPRPARSTPRALEGIDGLVNLSGAGIGDKRWNDAYKREVLESRTTSTDLLARTIAGLDRPPAGLRQRLGHGHLRRHRRHRRHRAEPGRQRLPRRRVRALGGRRRAPAAAAGIRVTHPRTGIVLSPNGGALAKLLPLFKLGVGGRMGSGRQWWSWISLDDEVGALRWLLDHDVAGPVNLTAPEPVTNGEMTKVLGTVLHRPTILPVPSFGPKLLLGGELAESLLFTSQRVLPAVLTEQGFPFAAPHPRGRAAGAARPPRRSLRGSWP